jgi:hypothetical protein
MRASSQKAISVLVGRTWIGWPVRGTPSGMDFPIHANASMIVGFLLLYDHSSIPFAGNRLPIPVRSLPWFHMLLLMIGWLVLFHLPYQLQWPM